MCAGGAATQISCRPSSQTRGEAVLLLVMPLLPGQLLLLPSDTGGRCVWCVLRELPNGETVAFLSC